MNYYINGEKQAVMMKFELSSIRFVNPSIDLRKSSTGIPLETDL